jgi:hypothetical protein
MTLLWIPPVTVLDPPGFTCAAACTPQVHNNRVKEHSGNIQGTFRDMQGTFRDMLGTFRDMLQGIFKKHAGHIHWSCEWLDTVVYSYRGAVIGQAMRYTPTEGL